MNKAIHYGGNSQKEPITTVTGINSHVTFYTVQIWATYVNAAMVFNFWSIESPIQTCVNGCNCKNKLY